MPNRTEIENHLPEIVALIGRGIELEVVAKIYEMPYNELKAILIELGMVAVRDIKANEVVAGVSLTKAAEHRRRQLHKHRRAVLQYEIMQNQFLKGIESKAHGKKVKHANETENQDEGR